MESQGIVAPLADVYPPSMCRNITRDQRIEGWRAFVELLPKFRPRVVGVMAAVEQPLRIAPQTTIETRRSRIPAKWTAYLETYLDGLRKAGLTE